MAQYIHGGVHLRYGVEITATSGILPCEGLCPPKNYDWEQLRLRVDILVSAKVVVII